VKVALVCDWYAPRLGGIELHLRDLAARLMRAGHEPVVVTPTPGPRVVDGIRVVRVQAPRAPHFGFLITPRGVRELGHAIAAEHPDVVHAHVSIVSPAALGGARSANRRKLPLVVTFHSVVPHTRLLARLARTSLGSARWRACFSAVSRRVARDVQPIAPGQPIHILPNGIDAGFWRAHDTRVPFAERDTARLVSVMRLNPKKRPLALVDMMRRVGPRLGSSRRVELRIVGDGPWRARLERAVRRADLARQIELLGPRSRESIRALFAESDLFVLPAIRESFGLAALEARCAGLPVVAMRASGVSELIEHDVHGLLADSDAELAAHVERLVSDPAKREALAAQSRTTTTPFDWSGVVDAHVALYGQAIQLRRACD
jgi:glycosyltransferase involved in cell wall biosynthesis